MKLIAFYFSCIILNGCINLSKCDSNVMGKYYCYNHNDAINYIEFHENGDFEHVFEKGKYRLIDKGKWELSKNGYCQILLNNWKNFNEKGENYEEFGNGIFINDNSLDMTPDGPSSTSFEKKSSSTAYLQSVPAKFPSRTRCAVNCLGIYLATRMLYKRW